MSNQKKRYDWKVIKLTKEDIKHKLDGFENRHGMTSKEFIKKYNKGELEENLEYLDWAGYYDMAADVGLISLKPED